MSGLAPYVHSEDTTFLRMADAAIALVPAAAGAIWFFGWPAAAVLLLSLAGSLGAEALADWLLSRQGLRDGSAIVSGLLVGLLLPAACPWWAALAGGALATAGKALGGGLGRNPVNPAALARALLLLTPSLRPAALRGAEGSFLIGYRGGCLGETSSLLLLAGSAYLILRGLLPYRITAPALAASFLTGLCIPRCDPVAVTVWGGTLLGAAYLAADPVTSPMGAAAQLVYGLAAGTLCTLGAFYGWGIGGVCCGILAANLGARAAERAARAWRKRGD